MISFFRQNRVTALQRKYDKLMKEAYELRSNPEISQQKQLEAQAVQREIINRSI